MSKEWCQVTYKLIPVENVNMLMDDAMWTGFLIGFLLPIMAMVAYKLIKMAKE